MDNADTGILGLADIVVAYLFAEVFNGTAVTLVDTAKHLDQRGLTGAVFAHQCVNLACFQFEVNTLQRVNTGEVLLDALHLQNCFAHSTHLSHSTSVGTASYFSFDYPAQKRNGSLMHFAPRAACQQYSLCIISKVYEKIKGFLKILY